MVDCWAERMVVTRVGSRAVWTAVKAVVKRADCWALNNWGD